MPYNSKWRKTTTITSIDGKFYSPILYKNKLKSIHKQECIPLGCVPPACCPYLPACTARGGGVPGPGGYLVWRGTWSQGVYLVPGGVPGPRGCTWSGGGTWSPGSVPGPRECTCPGTPPCEQNSWQTPMKILPCPKLRLRAVKTQHSVERQSLFPNIQGAISVIW